MNKQIFMHYGTQNKTSNVIASQLSCFCGGIVIFNIINLVVKNYGRAVMILFTK